MNSKQLSGDVQELTQFFHCTQPVLAELETSPQENRLTVLLQQIKQVSPSILKVMENRLLFLLVGILMKDDLPPGIRGKTLDCISAVILASKLENVDAFVRLYSLTCQQIFNVKDCALENKLPEELKESVMNCLLALITSVREDLLLLIYVEPMTKVISQGILLAAQIAKTEKSTKVRCSALNFILAMSQYGSENVELINKAGDMFINFLPGLVTPFSEIICKEDKTHHQVIKLTTRCWGHVLCLALRDIPSEETSLTETQIIQSWLTPNQKSKEEEWLSVLTQPKRTRQWTIAAAGTLQTVVRRVALHYGHPHEAVRQEMASVFGRLLRECSASLGSHAGPLLDALGCLNKDCSPQVQPHAVKALASLKTGVIPLLAQERLPEVVDCLARDLRSGDTSEVAKSLIMLAGYLDLFRDVGGGREGPCVISNPLLLHRLLSVLQTVARLRLSSEMLHQHDLDPSDFDSYQLAWHHMYEADKRTIATLERVCYHVGNWAMKSSSALLIDEFRASGPSALESLAVLSMSVRGWINHTPFLVLTLLQFYLEVNEQCDLSADLPASPKEQEAMVIKVVLSMDGIGSLARTVGEAFNNYLLPSLYPVVQRIGNSYSIVRSAAFAAAASLACACKKGSVAALIETNIDYLTHHIALRLRRTSTAGVLDAVRIIAKLCPAKALPHLQHIITEILSSSSAQFRFLNVSSYLRVFLAFVQCATAAVPPSAIPPTAMECDRTPGQLLMDYVKKKDAERISEEDISDSVQREPDAEPEEVEDPPKPKIPPYGQVAVNVVRRCLHYLPACTDTQKVLCLEILNTGLQVVAQWEDELLPLVHEIWSPLVRRFDAKAKPLVISRSFTLLKTLSSLAKDFIRFRTLKEVLPTLREYLVRSSTVSRKRKQESVFATTQGYKLQRELLSGLGEMVCDLRLRERETSLVVEAALPYLSKLQPTALQECAVELYGSLLQYDPCLVVYCLQPLSTNEEFSHNVQKIISYSK